MLLTGSGLNKFSVCKTLRCQVTKYKREIIDCSHLPVKHNEQMMRMKRCSFCMPGSITFFFFVTYSSGSISKKLLIKY